MSTAVLDNSLDTLLEHANRIKNGEHERVKPGQTFRIPDAWGAEDCGAQGDLIFIIQDKVPEGYHLVESPADGDRQLVWGTTLGAKHCLDSLDGVKLYRNEDWGPDSLDGPVIVCEKERTVLHPTHGAWEIPAGRIIKFEYPRERDAELKKERRNAD